MRVLLFSKNLFLKRYANHARLTALVLLSSANLMGFSNAMAQGVASAVVATELRPIAFSQLQGWQEDAVHEAWPAWMSGCAVLPKRGNFMATLCARAQLISPDDRPAIRSYFETHFMPHRLLVSEADAVPSGERANMVTGYYEPELLGSRTPTARFTVPLYRTPRDLVTVADDGRHPELRDYKWKGQQLRDANGQVSVVPYPSRGELEKQGLLRNKGLEIVYVEDPTEAFFLQVQGSGRIILEDGSLLRLAYANQNGHPYRSIGRWLVEQGELSLAQASMQGIKQWVANNPQRRDELFHQNPSMIFFKELPSSTKPTDGPIGSLGVPITAGRSIAIDPRYVALGLPVFLYTSLPNTGPIARLVMAQDTGSAILGPHRADFFFGSGQAAGELAGRMRAEGEMVLLLPRLP